VVPSLDLPNLPNLRIIPLMTRLTWEPITLHFRTPFRVSYGASESRRAHWRGWPAFRAWAGSLPGAR